MASEERNALAALAEALAWFGGSATARKPTIKMFGILGKAHRIIAELAKCQSCSHAVSGVSELLDNCRAIAEEGTK